MHGECRQQNRRPRGFVSANCGISIRLDEWLRLRLLHAAWLVQRRRADADITSSATAVELLKSRKASRAKLC